ncbi:hypothetical protein FQA39_LY10964 [Lamprigera yunnana]|nr:hypothetical protein FQA39_LY10964 [Lamprigera yunnana]
MKANSDNDFDFDDSHVYPAFLPSSEEYISDDSDESLTDSQNKGPKKEKIWKVHSKQEFSHRSYERFSAKTKKEAALEPISLDNIVAEGVGAIENELLEKTPFMTEEDTSGIPKASETEEVEEHNSYTVYSLLSTTSCKKSKAVLIDYRYNKRKEWIQDVPEAAASLTPTHEAIERALDTNSTRYKVLGDAESFSNN